jgi:hypothetical protein
VRWQISLWAKSAKMRQSRDSLASASVEHRSLAWVRCKAKLYHLGFRGKVARVTQTLTIGQLGERHCQILIPAGEVPQSQVASIMLDATTKIPVGKKADQLRENGAALIR